MEAQSQLFFIIIYLIQLIFKFWFIVRFFCSRANKQVLGESINLLAKGKNKQQWKIKKAVENDEEAKEEE